MAQGELDITALADGLDAPKRFLLPCRLSAMGREYCRRWFVNNPKHPEQDEYALVVAETEDEARKWAPHLSELEPVTDAQLEYRVMAEGPRCLGVLLVKRDHGSPVWHWLKKTF
jgi:hypothetical protein